MIHPSYQELIATINEGQVTLWYLQQANVQDRSLAELNRL